MNATTCPLPHGNDTFLKIVSRAIIHGEDIAESDVSAPFVRPETNLLRVLSLSFAASFTQQTSESSHE